ncbi:MAG: redox-regulated ATPase YchF [Candidatus Magasanikbacteria bacterium]|nr:redox-regulated ATPase YchF [Candidatus Magasanikbacteria bacterium]
MSLKIGIVGLPNVGKSTLFNALTRSKQADAQNYPFCTIEPNVGIVEVPDERLAKLAAVSKSQKIVPTAIEFVDIAGIVKGASTGEGLGNKFLAHIRETDAIAHIVRAFNDNDIIHVQNRVDPKDDADIINLELVLADLETASKRLDTTKKNAKGASAKDAAEYIALMERVVAELQAGKPARGLDLTEEEKVMLYDLHLITMKPMMYVVNVDELGASNANIILEPGVPHIYVCARMEAELADLSPTEAADYMKDLGVTESGLDKIIKAGYGLLNLITFLTSGEPETRAWTVKKGAKGPEAAGVIHTDFVKGYVKAEVTTWQDFVELNGWAGVKEKGKMRLEGKEYIVQDGDTVYFHIA